MIFKNDLISLKLLIHKQMKIKHWSQKFYTMSEIFLMNYITFTKVNKYNEEKDGLNTKNKKTFLLQKIETS